MRDRRVTPLAGGRLSAALTVALAGAMSVGGSARAEEPRAARLKFADAKPAVRAQSPMGETPPAAVPAPPSGPLGQPRPIEGPRVTAGPLSGAPQPLPNYPAPPAAGMVYPGASAPMMAPGVVTYPQGVVGGPPVVSSVPGFPGMIGAPGEVYPSYAAPSYAQPAPVPLPPVASAPVGVPAPGYGVFGKYSPLEAPSYVPGGAGVPADGALGGIGGRPLLGPAALLMGPQKLTLSGEVLLWWTQAARQPVLVTTGTSVGNGALGSPDTRVVYGGDTRATSVSPGGRFGFDYQLGDDRRWALDGRLFYLANAGRDFRTDTNEYPFLARPFTNANTGQPFSEIVAAPGLATGGVVVRPRTQVWGADINLVRNLCPCDPCNSLSIFGGYRYFHLGDQLTVTETFQRTGNSPSSIGLPGSLSGVVNDDFRTDNNFHGPQIGLMGERRFGRFFAAGRASVALGTVFQTVDINGGQQILTAAGAQTAAGGLLAISGANIGRRSRSEFGVLPEAGLTLGVYVTPRLKLGVGYNFIYLNNVLRAGDQIDTSLDVNRIPNFPLPNGAAPALNGVRPLPNFRSTDVFTQGISFSASYTW